MKRAVIWVAALVAAGACLCRPAQALPGGPPHEAATAAQSQPLFQVRGYRHHRQYGHQSQAARAATAEPAESGAVKPGQWEFAAQLQTSAPPQLPAAASQPNGSQSPQVTQIPAAGASKTTFSSCIVSDKAVPTAFGSECKLDGVQRNGPRITWSMTCTNPRNSVRSDGVAQYHGDTMGATVISHLPGAPGRMTDVTQHITGRYVGPCTQAAERAVPASVPNTPVNAPRAEAASGDSAQWVEPPPASGSAKPSGATRVQPSASAGESVATAGPERAAPRSRRYAAHRRHGYHRYYSGGYGGGVWPGRAGFLSIPFLGSLF
jgi:hypothetical protein